MSELLMPRLSDSMEEGTIIRWLKGDGEEIMRGEEVAEIETDKAIMAYESDFAGTLEIVAAEGATIPVGALIGRVGDGAGGAARLMGAATRGAGVATVSGSVVDAAETSSGQVRRPSISANGHGGRLRSSPLARRAALSLGIDLSGIIGSGPYGRILKADVLAASQAPQTGTSGSGWMVPRQQDDVEELGRTPTLRAGASGPAPVVPRKQDRVEELNRTQTLIAQRMSSSRRDVPEFALEVEVDMTEVIAMRAALRAASNPAPSINDVIVKACAVALRLHPRVNGSFAESQFVLRGDINVAIAVATENGLVAPVIHQADRKGLSEIAQEARALIERVRSGTVAPAELDGGTFTVSNLGMYGIDRFEGIINAPQAAILCVGSVRERPVAHAGQVVIRPLASLTLACDHRILYGADAAAFLGEVRSSLEAPLRMLL